MNRIAQLRKNKGLSQKELAQKLKISCSAVGMYEIGQRIPRVETAKQIADFFDVSIEYLFFNERKNSIVKK